MEEAPISISGIVRITFVSLIILTGAFFVGQLDTRTKIVFCDVGQGDAAYIRASNRYDIVIDAGPNNRVLNCLGKHMPFYDRTIELAILSHPQKDHFGGFLPLLERYQFKSFLASEAPSSNKTYQIFLEKLKLKKIHVRRVKAGNLITINNFQIKFVWPPTVIKSLKTDENFYSLIFTYEETPLRIWFTGDSTPTLLTSISPLVDYNGLFPLTILKIPHHGSKNGLTEKFLRLANPTLSVISVGKNNRFGHPSKEVIVMLKALGKKYLRTDEKGDIVLRINQNKSVESVGN